MRLTLCQLTFHENLFYATREVGRLYETGRYLHNYALTYALGFANSPYFQPQQIPRYAEELGSLNEKGIYVTPARGIDVRYQLATFKFANNANHVKMEQASRNIPTFGRAKEIAVGSVFKFGVIHSEDIRLPRWVRMGLWRSKGLLEILGSNPLTPVSEALQTADLPINPLDAEAEFQIYDLISMPPSSLVDNAHGKAIWLKAEIANKTLYYPAGMKYTFPT